MSIKVSVIMAAYNGEAYIEKSVQSILGQTFKNFEFIIVDDGSTDGTVDKIQQIDDPRVRIVRQSNQGQASALITGIQAAKGGLIARLDQDDCSLPDRLLRQVEFMNGNPKVNLCGTRFKEKYGENLFTQRVYFAQTNAEIKKVISFYNPFAHSAVMFRRDAYFQVGGYDKNFTICMDYDLYVRLMEVGEVYNMEEVLTVILMNKKSFSMRRSRSKTLEGMQIRCRAYSKFRGNLLLTGFYIFKSMVGLLVPVRMKMLLF
jgi:glycosyltransferase involved in cell wall biosynthesis